MLDDVALSVRAGEVVAVVGPNGAGKTTLLRTLSGLVRERSGSVRLNGTEIGALRPHRIARAGLAHVPEGRGTLGLADGRGEPAARRAGPLAQAGGRARGEMYDAFPVLGRLRANRAGLLSGGEQQMLVVARGLMGEPKLLAIDEPSMGLAPIMIRDLIEMLRTAVATGVAVLLVEQNTALAAELADRVYVLVRGTVAPSAPGGELPTDLLADYLV